MEITLKDGKSISVEQGAKPIDIASNTDKGNPSHNEVDKYISALAK